MGSSEANLCFPRTRRLLKPAEFRRVFDQPIKSVDRYFVILARQNGQGHARLGLALAKRKVKRAVDRNRLKRLARESFRHNTMELVDLDIIVLANRAPQQADSKELLQSLQKHWERLIRRLKNPDPKQKIETKQ